MFHERLLNVNYYNSLAKSLCIWRFLFSSFGEGNGSPLQGSRLGNPWAEEPGGLQPMGLQKSWIRQRPNSSQISLINIFLLNTFTLTKRVMRHCWLEDKFLKLFSAFFIISNSYDTSKCKFLFVLSKFLPRSLDLKYPSFIHHPSTVI